ncbi:MAG: hypothetical protein AMXMBFR46_13800 [Acidimicrobiia bacterium]
MVAPVDAAGAVATRTVARRRAGEVVVVAIAGPVAVGKSTLAAGVAEVIASPVTRVAVVGTDGFLFPNAVLERRGLALRKGFPESYDVDALVRFVESMRAGAPRSIPVYSHDTYDVVPGDRRVVPAADVVVIEGVNALSALSAAGGLVDLSVYLDAPEDVVEAWYVERFLALCESARPSSFYARFSGMDAAALDALAREVHRAVNVANLRAHIAPSRALAEVVIEKRADHSVATIVDAASR